MKYCKSGCGKHLNLLQGDYCEECYKRLPLNEKLREDIKNDSSLINTKKSEGEE